LLKFLEKSEVIIIAGKEFFNIKFKLQ